MNPVLIGMLVLITAGYHLVRLIAPASRRRREARAIRRLLLGEINDGARSFDDPGVADLLRWCTASQARASRKDRRLGLGSSS